MPVGSLLPDDIPWANGPRSLNVFSRLFPGCCVPVALRSSLRCLCDLCRFDGLGRPFFTPAPTSPRRIRPSCAWSCPNATASSWAPVAGGRRSDLRPGVDQLARRARRRRTDRRLLSRRLSLAAQRVADRSRLGPGGVGHSAAQRAADSPWQPSHRSRAIRSRSSATAAARIAR